MEAHDWEMEKKQRQSDEPEPLGGGAAAGAGGAGHGKSKARAKRPGRSTPILHSDVEKLRRERLNYFIDQLRVLVPISSTGT